MANNLFRFGLLMGDSEMLAKAKKMVHIFSNDFPKHPMAYSNWGNLMLKMQTPFYEVAVCGSNSKSVIQEMQLDYYPNVIWAHSNKPSNLPLLKNRYVQNEDLIYVCRNGVCQLPVKSIEMAKNSLK
jgi:uncharacterized protein YyaL (SSP411 family)